MWPGLQGQGKRVQASIRHLSPGVSAPTYWCDSQVTCALIQRKTDLCHRGHFMVSLGS